MAQLCINHNCVDSVGVIDEGLRHGRTDVIPDHDQVIKVLSESIDREEKLRLGSLNVGTMREKAGEVVETLTRSKVDVCCVQKIRWRGASLRTIMGKDSE